MNDPNTPDHIKDSQEIDESTSVDTFDDPVTEDAVDKVNDTDSDNEILSDESANTTADDETLDGEPENEQTSSVQTDVAPVDSEQSAEGEQSNDDDLVVRLPINLPDFSGPLELLVHLISKHELDIFAIPIAQITKEYMEIINQWEVADLDLAGEYLVLASTLIRLKARALIPKEEQEEEEEEIDDSVLEARRLEYERFRQLADDLRVREEENSALFPRIGPTPEAPKDVYEYEEVNVYDLYRTFQKIIEEIGNQPPRIVENESYSVDEKMLEIEALLLHNEHIILTDYLRTLQSKLEIIVVFMALLELLRLHEIKATQEYIHGQIVLVKGEKLAANRYDDDDSEDNESDE